jgi:hypothetical protein
MAIQQHVQWRTYNIMLHMQPTCIHVAASTFRLPIERMIRLTPFPINASTISCVEDELFEIDAQKKLSDAIVVAVLHSMGVGNADKTLALLQVAPCCAVSWCVKSFQLSERKVSKCAQDIASNLLHL